MFGTNKDDSNKDADKDKLKDDKDVDKDNIDASGDNETEDAAPELNEAEQEAATQGWVPKEQWVEKGGDPKEWRSAEVFLERGVLYRKIHDLSTSQKETQKALQTLVEHNKKLAVKERENIIAELEADKLEALKNDEHEKVIDIDKKLRKAESLKVDDSSSSTEPDDEGTEHMTEEQQREFGAWRTENPWYGTDSTLTDDADTLAIGYRARHPEKTSKEVLKYVETTIKRTNPDKFKPRDTDVPEAGGDGHSGKSRRGSNSLPKLSELPFELQKVAKELERTAGLEPKDYIKQLRELGEI